MSLRFIHVVTCVRISFLFEAKSYPIARIYHILFIHSPVGHLCGFYLLAIVNNIAMIMGIQISLWDPHFNSFECMPRSGIDGWYGKSMFNFLRTLHTAIYNGYTIIHSHHQQGTSVPISSHPHHFLFCVLFCFLIRTILMGMKWYLIVVLICIPLMISIFKNIYLFSWLCGAPVVSCGILVAACGIFCCGAWALHCGAQASL